MLPEEQAENSRYFYELASARFGWNLDVLKKVQAFHFKGGQGAKTGTGGHLPGDKVVGKIAEVRGLPEGTAAISPPRFPDWDSVDDFRRFADTVREESGGIPIGFKLSAQHIEEDLDAALSVGVDYVILDGRGGGTGAAPLLFRDHISVPTIPALARARAHLDRRGRRDVTLVITGGLRHAPDFAKALALGADAVAVANSAIQAIGCLGMRACNTNNCPVGIATQQPHLRARLPVDEAAHRLDRFLRATVELMQVLARACGHGHLSEFSPDDLTTFDRDMAHLTGIAYGGVDGAVTDAVDPMSDASRSRLTVDDPTAGRPASEPRRGVAQGRRARRPPRRPGPHGHGRPALAGADPRRRPLRRARQPLPAPGRPARRGLDREGPAALPVARLRLRPAHRDAARRVLRRAGVLPGRGARRRRLRRGPAPTRRTSAPSPT